jgi:hypothetical protein
MVFARAVNFICSNGRLRGLYVLENRLWRLSSGAPLRGAHEALVATLRIDAQEHGTS